MQVCNLSLQGFFLLLLVFFALPDKWQSHCWIMHVCMCVSLCSSLKKTGQWRARLNTSITAPYDRGEKHWNILPSLSLLLFVCVGSLSLSLPLILPSSSAVSTAPSVYFSPPLLTSLPPSHPLSLPPPAVSRVCWSR